MELAYAPIQSNPENRSERKCLVTGKTLPKDDLIRFVIAPDHSVVPDLAHNLPGRGLWVTADRSSIEIAAKKNLFAKAAKTAAKPDSHLADIVANLLRKRCLDFLGLARRSGIAVLGQPQVEAAMKGAKLALLLLADDATQMTDVRYQMSGSTGSLTSDICHLSSVFTRDELGAALGHDQLVYVGLQPHNLTERLQAELARLEKIAGNPHILKERKQQEK
jgi:predicted RNA-binding protein YlxR (DUF448 family)